VAASAAAWLAAGISISGAKNHGEKLYRKRSGGEKRKCGINGENSDGIRRRRQAWPANGRQQKNNHRAAKHKRGVAKSPASMW
jgi:hypothetical protein